MDIAAAVGNVVHGLAQLLGRGVLQHVSCRPAPQRVQQVFRLCEHGEDNHFGIREILCHLFARDKPALSGRHGYIQQQHVGFVAGHQGICLRSLGGFGHNLDIGIGVKQHFYAGSYHDMVIGEHYADHRASPSSLERMGVTKVTRVPRSFDSTESVAPTWLARSCMPSNPQPVPLMAGCATSKPQPSSTMLM